MSKSIYTPEQQAENREKAAIYKDRRLELGLSQRQLARMAGISRKTVGSLEGGEKLPKWDTRQKIRCALGMPEERYYTQEQRNAILAELIEHEVIEWEIRRNMQTLKRIGASAFLDDLRQDCAVCAIRAIDRFQLEGAACVKTFVKKNLRGFIKNWILVFRLHGMSGRTHPIPQVAVYSLDALMEERL